MNEVGVVALIQTHLARYPESEVTDIYKLLHQATFGFGHPVSNKKAAREWLEREMERLTPAPGVPLVESIHPDQQIVRMHLRSYLTYQRKIKPLLEAFVRSAQQVTGDRATMEWCWRLFEALCQPSERFAEHFVLREVLLFGRGAARAKWPAAIHSPAYENAYQPKYRVLTRAEAAKVCDKVKAPFEII